jgi:HTH-type transcriptional regulator, sugar sensing transcriptional regulator
VAVELLQRIGLNKYEAEAYYSLLVEGSLTGYELGKRSGVPLSRSYEILERLARRGLALVQPGEPPRYAAERPERFLEQTRADQTATLAALTAALAAVERPDSADEFWVVRGRANVLAQARALIDEARQELILSPRSDDDPELAEAIGRAMARGCRLVGRPVGESARECEPILLLVDGREALVGALRPAASCQAVVSANPALAEAVRGALAWREPVSAAAGSVDTAERSERLDWVSWEDRKQQRLWQSIRGGRVA